MRRALLSVSDKTGIVDLAKFLVENDVEIVSTGGTAKLLEENGIKIIPITEVTGNPEAFGGRMKSISFQVGSALLYRRKNNDDVADAEKLGIKPIDFVVCNLYPFIEVSKKTDDLPTLIENIDIGGPTMIRAAAKNYPAVSILTSPTQYEAFTANFQNINEEFNYKLALAAFKMTAEYDQFIINTLDEEGLPVATTQETTLRYGENPHQSAVVIPWKNTQSKTSLQSAEVIQGKQLSYNNLVDADAGWKCTSELHWLYPNKKVTTIIKHANPCGVAVSESSSDSISSAWACDPVSSFGSIIACNYTIDADFFNWIQDKFVEIIIAPDFTQEALDFFAKKKNLRLLKTPVKPENSKEQTVKSINGALLIQEEDEKNNYEFKTVTTTQIPTDFVELRPFGMIVNKYLKSNSISLVGKKDGNLVIAGSGMGQPNRLDALKMLAAPRAKELGFEMAETLLISDAFFPFRDSIEVANEVGIKNIIQPGGSIRDQEVIDACNEFNIAMDFTATRHFRH